MELLPDDTEKDDLFLSLPIEIEFLIDAGFPLRGAV